MHWDEFAGAGRQLIGRAKQRLARLTGDRWMYIDGTREELVGRVQVHYCRGRHAAERTVDRWLLDSDEPQPAPGGSVRGWALDRS